LDRLEALVGQIIVAHEAALRRLERLENVVELMHQEGERERDEAKLERVLQNKRWGEITMKMGTFVEDMVVPNIPRLGRRHFRLGEPELSAPRLRVRHASDPARRREFDYVYVAPEGWIVNETKTNARSQDVDNFREMLAEIHEYFPQYQARPLYPIFSSLYLGEDVVNYCTKHGIYALGMGQETMELLNAAAVRR
jgi:hypothetical protein